MKRYYILHYFDPANVGSFLLVSLLGLILVLALVLLIAKLQIQRQLKEETEEKAKKIRRKKHQRRQYQIVESFYELVFSGTSILLFLSLYYIIDERPASGYSRPTHSRTVCFPAGQHNSETRSA